jgi:hypothetical protein
MARFFFDDHFGVWVEVRTGPEWVTSIHNCIQPQVYFPDTSVDPTEARLSLALARTIVSSAAVGIARGPVECAPGIGATRVVVMVPWLCPERREPANVPVGRSDRTRCGPDGQLGAGRPGDAPRRPRRARASRSARGERTAVVRRQAQQGRGHVAHLRFESARCLVRVRSSVDAQEGRTIDVLARNMTFARRPS